MRLSGRLLMLRQTVMWLLRNGGHRARRLSAVSRCSCVHCWLLECKRLHRRLIVQAVGKRLHLIELASLLVRHAHHATTARRLHRRLHGRLHGRLNRCFERGVVRHVVLNRHRAIAERLFSLVHKAIPSENGKNQHKDDGANSDASNETRVDRIRPATPRARNRIAIGVGDDLFRALHRLIDRWGTTGAGDTGEKRIGTE